MRRRAGGIVLLLLLGATAPRAAGGEKWQRLALPAPVPPKLYHTLAYDESRDVFVCQTRPLKWYVMRLDPAKLETTGK